MKLYINTEYKQFIDLEIVKKELCHKFGLNPSNFILNYCRETDCKRKSLLENKPDEDIVICLTNWWLKTEDFKIIFFKETLFDKIKKYLKSKREVSLGLHSSGFIVISIKACYEADISIFDVMLHELLHTNPKQNSDCNILNCLGSSAELWEDKSKLYLCNNCMEIFNEIKEKV